MPTNKAMVMVGLARLEGRCTVERWGLRIQHVGKRGLCNTGQKRNEKKKNISLLTCP